MRTDVRAEIVSKSQALRQAHVVASLHVSYDASGGAHKRISGSATFRPCLWQNCTVIRVTDTEYIVFQLPALSLFLSIPMCYYKYIYASVDASMCDIVASNGC